MGMDMAIGVGCAVTGDHLLVQPGLTPPPKSHTTTRTT
jgi:hypothetical protein